MDEFKLHYIGTKDLTREEIKELKDQGIYLEYCDTGTRTLKVDVFESIPFEVK